MENNFSVLYFFHRFNSLALLQKNALVYKSDAYVQSYKQYTHVYYNMAKVNPLFKKCSGSTCVLIKQSQKSRLVANSSCLNVHVLR